MRIFCGTVRKIRDKKIRNPKAGKEGKGEQKKTERRPGEKDKRGKLNIFIWLILKFRKNFVRGTEKLR